MRYKLTAPCATCPFRQDVTPFLTAGRARDIAFRLLQRQQTFSCHKTNDYTDEGDAVETPKSQHCAGALILLERARRPNQMMRIAERLGLYDASKLELNHPALYPSLRAFVRAHVKANV